MINLLNDKNYQGSLKKKFKKISFPITIKVIELVIKMFIQREFHIQKTSVVNLSNIYGINSCTNMFKK